jgi:hypothetical protein
LYAIADEPIWSLEGLLDPPNACSIRMSALNRRIAATRSRRRGYARRAARE